MKRLSGLLVGLAIIVASGGALGETPSTKYLLIYLKCPSENGGVFERVAANLARKRTRVRVIYDSKGPERMFLDSAPADREFSTAAEFDVRAETDPDKKFLIQQVIKGNDRYLRDGCLAPQAKREEFFATLKANRKALGLP